MDEEIFKIMDEILRVKQALRVTKSKQLTHQYSLHLYRSIKRMKDYCKKHHIAEKDLRREYEKYKLANTKVGK